jgi:hypothetical protein
MNKWIGGALQIVGAFLFFAAGAEEEVLFLPAAIAQLSGLAVWSRGWKSAPSLPRPETEALDARLARIEEVLASVQDDTVRLRERGDFMDELYAEKEPRPREIGRQTDR